MARWVNILVQWDKPVTAPENPEIMGTLFACEGGRDGGRMGDSLVTYILILPSRSVSQ